jgi:hypothetical protein
MPKPELGPVKVGDKLLIIANSRYSKREPLEAEVVKVGRKYVYLKEVDGHRYAREYQCKLSSQYQVANHTPSYRFVTQEQYAWEKRNAAAEEFLKETGIEFRLGSRSRYLHDQLTLANLIRAHEGLPLL